VKRGQDRAGGSALNVRDEQPQGPMVVERLTPQDRHRQFSWRVPAALFVAVALLALAGRAADWYEAYTRVIPVAPTPIAWVNAIVSPGPSGEAVAPSNLPAITAEANVDSFFWTAGAPNHFTLRVTNTSSAPIPLTPCPTYAMFVVGTPANLATVRALNCADIGATFAPGETLALDMIYTPAATDPRGFQSVEWQAVSGFRATARLTSIEIER
jgi:hypothetical protein